MSKLIEQLKAHEGFRSKPYKCTADKLTIGYGLNLDAGIDGELAEIILNYQIQKVKSSLDKFSWYASIDSEQRKDVIVNMAFNLGVAGVCKFIKMINAISLHDYHQATTEMLDSKWAKQVGNRSVELAEQMRSGQYK